MTIDKADEELKDLTQQPWIQPFPDYIDAIKLGREALKREVSNRRTLRDFRIPGWNTLLPGETEE